MIFNDALEYREGKLFWTKTLCNQAMQGSRAGYVRNQDGYRSVQYRGYAYKEHRIIWIMHYGDIPAGMQIDHLNGVRDDNRIENLRLVSQTVNNLNTYRSKNNRSGVTGVSWYSRGAKWRVDYRSKRVGVFSDFIDACEARIIAEVSDGLATARHGADKK